MYICICICIYIYSLYNSGVLLVMYIALSSPLSQQLKSNMNKNMLVGCWIFCVTQLKVNDNWQTHKQTNRSLQHFNLQDQTNPGERWGGVVSSVNREISERYNTITWRQHCHCPPEEKEQFMVLLWLLMGCCCCWDRQITVCYLSPMVHLVFESQDLQPLHKYCRSLSTNQEVKTQRLKQEL